MLTIGFGHSIAENLIVCLIDTKYPTSAPVRRFINESQLINLTNGRARKSGILINSNIIILSALSTETLIKRLNDLKNGDNS